MRVLVVDDHAATRTLIARSLGRDGHRVQEAASVAEALGALDEKHDVLVLDVMLPDGSGFELSREIRRRGIATPVLLLTARSDVSDRVAGLDAGADDYLVKPFAVAELQARVRALGRRGPVVRDTIVSVGEITVDVGGRRVTVAGRPVPLTARELAVLEVLAMRKGRVVATDDLLEMVWGAADEKAKASLEVLITRIRRKLGASGAALRTQRGVGYLLEAG